MNIEKKVDNLVYNKRNKRGHKKMALVGLAVFIAFTMIATAALLPHFAKGTTKATVLQSVVVSKTGDEGSWLNYDEPFETEIEDMIHCTNYCNKRWIWNRACADAPVVFDIIEKQAPGGDWEGFEVQEFLFGETQTVKLRQKHIVWDKTPWEIVENQVWATLTFNTCGKTFDWEIEYSGLCHAPHEFSLVYYPNYPEYWDGTHRVYVIAEGLVPTGESYGFWAGSYNSLSMPHEYDENALRPIIDEGESYVHQYGAKVWLIPSECILEGNTINWGSDRLWETLWETDLIFYMDCDDMTPEPLPNVWPLFNLICGDVATLKSEHVYCWITCNHVALDIVPGTYKYDQILSLNKTS